MTGLRPAAALAAALVAACAAGAARAEPPVVPADVVAEAQGPGGAVVTYEADPTASCTPGPGSLFPLGSTAVTCTNDDGSGAFTVTVVDTTPPSVGAFASVTIEAAGPAGAAATYTTPAATDLVDGTVPAACAPASGTTFPLGPTTVTCTAADTAGNTGQTSGTVTVADTTPPTLTPPAAIGVTASSAAGLPASHPLVAAFLAGATASDAVTASPAVANDAPATFPIGTTTVTFTATDGAGNAASGTSSVTVGQPNAPPPPPEPAPAPPPVTPPATPPVAPAPVDRTPPRNVSGVRVVPGSGSVTLTWTLPPDPDLSRVRVLRTPAASPAAAPAVVYEGTGTTVRDTRLRNGVQYRYVIVSLDRAGNRSAGVAVLVRPGATMLWAPANGQRVVSPPLLVWAKVSGASYYNVQLFRGGRKVLTAWPTTSRLKLTASWRVGTTRQRLVAGTYRWYVWPGYGPRARARYGGLLGSSTFTLAPARR